MRPAQSLVARETPVHADPFASGIQGESGVVCVWNKVPARIRFSAKPDEMHPMVAAGRQDLDFIPAAEILHKLEGQIEGRGFLENLRMGHDAEKAAENQIGHRDATRFHHRPLYPIACFNVEIRVLAMNLHEYVHIKEFHHESIRAAKEAFE